MTWQIKREKNIDILTSTSKCNFHYMHLYSYTYNYIVWNKCKCSRDTVKHFLPFNTTKANIKPIVLKASIYIGKQTNLFFIEANCYAVRINYIGPTTEKINSEFIIKIRNTILLADSRFPLNFQWIFFKSYIYLFYVYNK